MAGIKICGTGHYQPELVVKNDDFLSFIETSDEWIRTRTGIAQRHISVDMPAWKMGSIAAERAMEDAGVQPQEIDMILVTSVTPEFAFPSQSCLIQDDLGMNNSSFSIDINVACSGLSYSLDMARRYLTFGDVKTVLIIAAERLSQVTNFEDRTTCVLLGDGAGAMVVRTADTPFGAHLYSDGSGGKHLYARRHRKPTPFDPEGGIQDRVEPFEPEVMEYLYMNGKEVYKFATQAMPKAIRGACESAGIPPEELDVIIPHQANARIIETAIKNMKLPAERFFVNIDRWGNTSSATIMIAIDEAIRSGRLKRGDKTCIVGFGAGLTVGANVFVY